MYLEWKEYDLSILLEILLFAILLYIYMLYTVYIIFFLQNHLNNHAYMVGPPLTRRPPMQARGPVLLEQMKDIMIMKRRAHVILHQEKTDQIW